MSEAETLESLALTVEKQAVELTWLRERLEDLEDLRDWQEAMVRTAGQPFYAWEAVRAELGLTDKELARAASENWFNAGAEPR